MLLCHRDLYEKPKLLSCLEDIVERFVNNHVIGHITPIGNPVRQPDSQKNFEQQLLSAPPTNLTLSQLILPFFHTIVQKWTKLYILIILYYFSW